MRLALLVAISLAYSVVKFILFSSSPEQGDRGQRLSLFFCTGLPRAYHRGYLDPSPDFAGGPQTRHHRE
jgi:hypothetical protein